MSGRWNQRMKIMYLMYQGVGICFRIPKSLRLAYVSLHSAQHTYARQKTREWTVLSFPLSGQSTRKVKMPRKCLATTLPLILGNICEGQPGGYGQDCSLVPETRTEPSSTRGESTEGMESPVQLIRQSAEDSEGPL